MAAPNGNSTAAAAGVNLAEIPSHFVGGNNIEVAPPSAVKDFVVNHGGHSVISSVSTYEKG